MRSARYNPARRSVLPFLLVSGLRPPGSLRLIRSTDAIACFTCCWRCCLATSSSAARCRSVHRLPTPHRSRYPWRGRLFCGGVRRVITRLGNQNGVTVLRAVYRLAAVIRHMLPPRSAWQSDKPRNPEIASGGASAHECAEHSPQRDTPQRMRCIPGFLVIVILRYRPLQWRYRFHPELQCYSLNCPQPM